VQLREQIRFALCEMVPHTRVVGTSQMRRFARRLGNFVNRNWLTTKALIAQLYWACSQFTIDIE
jgi:hypothetical protein